MFHRIWVIFCLWYNYLRREGLVGTKIAVLFLFFPISLCARDAIAKTALFHIMYWFLLGSSLGKALH